MATNPGAIAKVQPGSLVRARGEAPAGELTLADDPDGTYRPQVLDPLDEERAGHYVPLAPVARERAAAGGQAARQGALAGDQAAGVRSAAAGCANPRPALPDLEPLQRRFGDIETANDG